MKKINWPSIYAYLICLVMLIAFIFSGNQLIRSALNFMVPDERVGSITETIKHNPQFERVIIEQDAKILYEEKSKEFYRTNNLNGLVSGLLMIIVILPVYLYHWKLGNKYRTFEGGAISVRSIYFYLASLITLTIGVVAALMTIDTLTNYIIGNHVYMPSLDELFYKEMRPETQITITKEQIVGLIEKSQDRRYFPRELLISQLTTLIIAVPLYIVHWAQAKKIYPVQ